METELIVSEKGIKWQQKRKSQYMQFVKMN